MVLVSVLGFKGSKSKKEDLQELDEEDEDLLHLEDSDTEAPDDDDDVGPVLQVRTSHCLHAQCPQSHPWFTPSLPLVPLVDLLVSLSVCSLTTALWQRSCWSSLGGTPHPATTGRSSTRSSECESDIPREAAD